MTIPSLLDLLKKHKDSAPDPHQFVQTVAAKCGTSKSTVYRWVSTESKPSGEHVLILAQHLQTLKEPQP